ncbi:MAG: alanine--tRNA ligase [bacterium]|nr:alanine--tRNA ligase [bacterium]
MTSNELRQKYLDFFRKRGHKVIPSAPLVPENDPSVLFTTAGMHPLVPFLLGQPHPQGKKLVDCQKCLRTDDIDEVGDYCHHTFFEMLGNWSLGDYFKEEAIKWSYEFLTSKEGLNLPKEKLAFSVFEGDQDVPFDEESRTIWLNLGIPKERIAALPRKENWWPAVWNGGPGGPDTEMFYWTGEEEAPQKFDPDDKRWVEIWNDVFMEYNKLPDGKVEKLVQKNVDTGMGLERTLAVVNRLDDDYQTELFLPAIEKIEQLSGLKYADYLKEFRIITDHLRATTFVISDGVEPSNKERGYILRRLIRRSVVKIKGLKIENVAETAREIAQVFIDLMSPVYPELKVHQEKILETIDQEIKKFNQTLEKGLREFQKLSDINGKIAFDLFQTYGFPLELTTELAEEKGIKINKQEFQQEFEKHQELSRTASVGMFKGGLADQSEITTKYHTATHLLHAALRQVLGDHVAQKGSNITAQRLRFDFSQPEKLTEEQLKMVEDLVNQKIKEALLVTPEVMDKDQALKSGALGFFGAKYGDKVTVFTIGPSTPSGHSGSPFSREICGGPHVQNTKELGSFKITKEESAGSGIRRIYATLSWS